VTVAVVSQCAGRIDQMFSVGDLGTRVVGVILAIPKWIWAQVIGTPKDVVAIGIYFYNASSLLFCLLLLVGFAFSGFVSVVVLAVLLLRFLPIVLFLGNADDPLRQQVINFTIGSGFLFVLSIIMVTALLYWVERIMDRSQDMIDIFQDSDEFSRRDPK
jgi:hypothetical protein